MKVPEYVCLFGMRTGNPARVQILCRADSIGFDSEGWPTFESLLPGVSISRAGHADEWSWWTTTIPREMRRLLGIDDPDDANGSTRPEREYLKNRAFQTWVFPD